MELFPMVLVGLITLGSTIVTLSWVVPAVSRLYVGRL
jgi:hypothetical protein